MLVNIVWPSPPGSGRAIFNSGWVTLLVMALIVASARFTKRSRGPPEALESIRRRKTKRVLG